MTKKVNDFVKGLKALGVKFTPVKIRRVSRAKLEREVQKYNDYLNSLAKQPSELIVPVELRVLEATFYGFGGRTITPTSESTFGGVSPRYGVGDCYGCKFRVDSQTDPKIKTLDFIGWPAIERGNRIRAYIFAGEEKGKKYIRDGTYNPQICEFSRKDSDSFGFSVNPTNPFVFVLRDFKEREKAVRIEKLDSDKQVLALWEAKKD